MIKKIVDEFLSYDFSVSEVDLKVVEKWIKKLEVNEKNINEKWVKLINNIYLDLVSDDLDMDYEDIFFYRMGEDYIFRF